MKTEAQRTFRYKSPPPHRPNKTRARHYRKAPVKLFTSENKLHRGRWVPTEEYFVDLEALDAFVTSVTAMPVGDPARRFTANALNVRIRRVLHDHAHSPKMLGGNFGTDQRYVVKVRILRDVLRTTNVILRQEELAFSSKPELELERLWQ